MKRFYKKPDILVLIVFIVFFIFNAPVYSKEIDVKTYTGKITKAESYLIDWEWWENFDDPMLLELLKQSINNNFDLQIADLKINEAKNYVNSSKRNYSPFFRMQEGYRLAKPSRIDSFGWKKYEPIYNVKRHLLYSPLQVSYELDFLGKNRTEKRYFLENKDFYEFEKRFVTLTTVTEVSSLYFNILKNEKLISLYQEINDLKQEKLEIIFEKFKLELVTELDVIEAKKEAKASEENLLTLSAINGELKNRLSLLVFGDKQRDEINFNSLDYVNLFYSTDLEISTDKIAYRPDVLMVEKQVKMAKLEERGMKKSLFPSFVLSGETIHISEMFQDYFSPESAAFRFGGGIFYNLFEKGKNRAELRARKNIYEQALKNYEKAIVSSINDVNDSLFHLKSSIKNYERSKAISGLDRESLDFKQQKLDMEMITYLDYMKTKEQLIKSRIAEYETRTQCLIHIISVYKALGGNG